MKVFCLILGLALGSAFSSANKIIPIRKNIGGRIIGGELARAGQFPFAAAITTSTANGNFFCGGSLLDEQWILTNGQCVDGGHLFTIRLGTNHLNTSDADTQLVSSDTYVIHPDFNPLTLDNDIGLIWLRLPVTFSDYLKPFDFLPLSPLSDYSSGVAIGWGQVGDQSPGLTNDLQWVSVTTLPNTQCKLTYGNQVTDNMVCVDGNYNEGTCNGDSGGPLVQQLSRVHYVVAAVSTFLSGNGCESTDPSGYTRVYQYNAWISSITGKPYSD